LTGDKHTDHISSGQRVSRHTSRPDVFYFFPPHFFKNNFSQPHGQAHLIFADTRANAKKPKELALTHQRQYCGLLHYQTV
jgi:hypothetical protein